MSNRVNAKNFETDHEFLAFFHPGMGTHPLPTERLSPLRRFWPRKISITIKICVSIDFTPLPSAFHNSSLLKH